MSYIFTKKFWSKIWSCQYFMKYRKFEKSVFNKIFLFLIFKYKLKTEFPFGEWNITLYVFHENFNIYIKTLFLKKSCIKSKNLYQQIIFIFKFYNWIWKFCRNRVVIGWDIANSLFRDNVQHLKKRFVFKKINMSLKGIIHFTF